VFHFNLYECNNKLYEEFQTDNLLHYNKLKCIDNDVMMTISYLLSKQFSIPYFKKCCDLKHRIKNTLFYYSSLVIHLYKKKFIIS